MKVFLTYASEQKSIAETVAFSLRSRGFGVFLDKDDLPPGRSYDEQIEAAIRASDYLVYLISPQSVQPGRYTRTELEFARRKWRNPDGHILPVMVVPVDMTAIPEFLRAVTILEPKGNIAAEVSSHVKANDRVGANNLLLSFGGMGLVTGLLTSLVYPNILHPFAAGIFFGLGICGLFWRCRAPIVSLVMAFLIVQGAWCCAWQCAAELSDIIKYKERPHSQATGIAADSSTDISENAESSGDAHDSGDRIWDKLIRINWSYIIPGLVAGAIGAFGTWMAGAMCHTKLRAVDACLVTTSVGSILGTLLAFDYSVALLFLPWQSAVAASLATSMTRVR